ncbi:hypothetical protein K493DRAFT_57244 [Basidiobolus meristosporus CBS 931.73]|uniref:Uncharacterized protein n=1 Tax=Basidiobolus meristosporus CBS 931.73 TaxID=1314790 RepID=A0A1Y1XZ83_9FUNG|nr:hypothetical protein K493DRAFT_57244 [Basidiobolus meristosporus CBS 931.73]|eukprot:ORX90674.1 hypothetical protein K493DRAFT_57244 [Basidiobolus meristosporus CBS 931.73]
METAKKKGKEKVRSKGETTKADKKRTPEKASKRKHEESVEEPPRKKKSGVETTPVKAHPKSDDEKAKKKKSKKKKKEKAHKQSSSSVKQEPEGNKKPTPPPTTPASPPKTPTIKDVEVKHTKDSKKEKKAKKNKKEKKRKGEKENPAKPESNESNLEVKTNSPKKRKSSKLDAPDAEKLKTKDLPPSTPAALAKSAAAKPQRKPKISDTQTAPSDKKVPPQPQATQQQSIASKSAGARKAVAIPIPAAATISQPAKATKKAAPIAVPTTKNGSKKRHPLTPAIIPDDSDEEFTPELLDDNKAKAKPPKKMKLPAMCGGTEFLAETQEEAAQRIQEYEEFRRKRQEVVGSTGKIEFNADGVSLIQEKWA